MFVEELWSQSSKWHQTWDNQLLYSRENGVRWAVILYRKSMGSVLVVWIHKRLFFICCRVSCDLSLHCRYKYSITWQLFHIQQQPTQQNDWSIRQFSCVPLIACVILNRKVVHFARIFTGFITTFSSNPKDFLQCKYMNFQRDPFSVKADRWARISNVNILVMDNLVNTCVF